MKSFVYLKTVKTIFGNRKISMLPKELSQIGKYPLLVYGNKSLKSSGNLTKIRNLLKKFKFAEFNGIKDEPDINMINEAYLLSESKKIDSVIAIGGGSVIDASKAIALAIGNKVSPIKIFRKKIKKNALPLITIPTLPGSGSEVNGGGVIFVSGKKKEISGIFPRVSILDPDILNTVLDLPQVHFRSLYLTQNNI